jgi:uncharacterized protein (TIGR04255 family)
MSLQRLQPFAGTHAIQQVNFTFHWAPLPMGAPHGQAEACLAEMNHAMLGLGLQNVTPISMMQIQMQAGAIPVALAPTAAHGFEGRLPQVPGAPGFAVTASAPDGLTVQVSPYTRWAPVVGKVLEMARVLVPIAAKVVPLTRIGLQVVDSFNWNAPIEELPIDAILSRSSPWLASHVFECRNFWHCNHGYFEPVALAGCVRQLNNVNVSVSGVAERPMLQAALVHVLELSEGGWWLREAVDIQRLAVALEHLHACNKTAMGQLLSAEVAERVALWGVPSREPHDDNGA